MNELTKPLRTASVPVYALSTWQVLFVLCPRTRRPYLVRTRVLTRRRDTDYLLVPSSKFTEAAKALEDAGWTLVLPKAVAEG
jgi:hypothetical protein